MPGKKNTKGGKKYKRTKKCKSRSFYDPLDIDDCHRYGIVIKRLGGPELDIRTSDYKERRCRIRGTLMKRVRVNKDDIILVSLRSDLSNDNKCDMLHKFNLDECNILRSKNKLDFIKKFDLKNNDDFTGFTFEEYTKGDANEKSNNVIDDKNDNIDDNIDDFTFNFDNL